MSGALWKKEELVGSISTPNFLRFLPDPTIDARVDARV